MEALSDAISLLDGQQSLFSRLEAGGDWAIDFDGHGYAKFGAVLRGSCWLSAEGTAQPVLLAEHDCYLVGNGRGYRLFSGPGVPPVHASVVYAGLSSGVTRWGAGSQTVVAGGRMELSELDSAALANVLPPLAHLPAACLPGRELHEVLRLIEHETAAPRFGAVMVTERLFHIAFVQFLRGYAATQDEPPGRLLAALTDPQVGTALALMHQDPARRWTVTELALASRMSRSGFAARFTELAGAPPQQYLLALRMRMALWALRASDKSIAEIAQELGYSSDSAFSNTFKRVMGQPPSTYRPRVPAAHRRSGQAQGHDRRAPRH